MASEIERIIETYSAAVLARDIDAFLALYADDVVVYDAWDQWAYRGKREWSAAVGAWLSSDVSSELHAGFDEVMISGHGSVAAASGRVCYRAVGRHGSELRSIENRITWLLRRTADGWRIHHEHTSVPVDFQTKSARLTYR